MITKWYIFSSPCQGKSTFIKKNNKFGDYKLYDFDDKRPKYINCSSLSKMKDFSVILGGFSTHNDKIIESELKKCVNFGILAVIIPEEQLESNLIARKNSKKRNSKWAKRNNVFNSYEKLKKIAERHKITTFKSFEDALRYINEQE